MQPLGCIVGHVPKHMPMKKLSILLVVLIVSGCEWGTETIAKKEPALLGEWRFFTVSNHNADMIWDIDTFQFEKAPRLIFLDKGAIAGRTHVNEFNASYTQTTDYVHPQKIAKQGNLTLQSIRRLPIHPAAGLNLPPDVLLTSLENTSSYYVQKSGKYEYLSLSHPGSAQDYLLFVRKTD